MVRKEIWQNLEKHRKRLKLTEENWRKILGVTPSVYQKFRELKRSPTLTDAFRLCKKLGISLRDCVHKKTWETHSKRTSIKTLKSKN